MRGALIVIACVGLPACVSFERFRQSSTTTLNGVPTCADGIRNNGETDVDCGGSACGVCGRGKGCALDRDCDAAPCIANVCTCIAESDAVFCTRLNKSCGPANADDNCGALRSVASCGSCTAPAQCTADGSCACTGQSDATLCSAQSASCGAIQSTDICGATRNIASCGFCTNGRSCTGSHTCQCPQTDAAFCSAAGKNCNALSGTDSCGDPRNVASCGSCSATENCLSGVCTCFAETPDEHCVTHPTLRCEWNGQLNRCGTDVIDVACPVGKRTAQSPLTFLNGNTGSPLTNQSTIFYAADTALTMMIFQMGPGDAFGCHLTSTDTTYFAAYNSGNSSWHAWTLPSPFVRTNFANVSTGLNGEYAFAMASIGSRVIGINATADGFAGFTVAYPQFTDATLSVTTFTPSDPYNPAGFGLPVGLSGSVGAINGVAIGGDDLIFAYRRGNEVFIAERDNVISNFTAYRDATAEFTATINGVPQVLLPRSFSRDGRIALAEAGFNVFEFTRLSRHSATPSGFTPFQPRKNPATTAADGIGGFRTVLRGACQGSSAPLVGTCVGGCAGERICFYQ